MVVDDVVVIVYKIKFNSQICKFQCSGFMKTLFTVEMLHELVLHTQLMIHESEVVFPNDHAWKFNLDNYFYKKPLEDTENKQ